MRTVVFFNKTRFNVFRILAMILFILPLLLACTGGKAKQDNVKQQTTPEVRKTEAGQTSRPSPTGQPTQETKKSESPAASQQPVQFSRPITEPLKATVSTQAVTLGDLGKQQVQVAIPAGSLASGAVVTVVNPEKAPAMDSRIATPLGAPVSISIGDKPTRLKHLTTVTLGIDKKNIPPGTDPAAIQVAYYNGKAWEYSRPDKVDLQAGRLTFTTDHFSLWQVAGVDIKTRIEKKIHSETLAEMAQEKLDDTVDKLAEQAIDHLLKDRLGIVEESKKFKVLSSLLKDDEYKDLYDNYKDGDVLKFVQTLNVFVGKKIVENVEDSDLTTAFGRLSKGALGDLASKEGVGYLESISQAMGYVAEGNYRGAGEIIGGKIADEFLIYKAAKVSKEVMQYGIDLWRDDKIEAAFNAYKLGASKTTAGGFDKGYDVDAGDFEGVWNQMVALQERLQHEAVEKEKALRLDLRLNPLTPAEEAKLRANVKTNMEKEFKKRKDTEQSEAELKKLVDAFEAKGLLNKTSGSFRWTHRPAEGELESRIDELLRFRDRIVRDTRNNPKGKKLTNDDIVTLTVALLSGTPAESKKLYAQFLVNMFGVVPLPEQPVAKVNPSPFSGEPNKDYTFTAAVTPPVDKARYDWLLNGKQIQSGGSSSVKVNFPSDGAYTISLKVVDASGKQQLKSSARADIKKSGPTEALFKGRMASDSFGNAGNPFKVSISGTIKGDPGLRFEGTSYGAYAGYLSGPVLSFIYSIPTNATKTSLDFERVVVQFGEPPTKFTKRSSPASPGTPAQDSTVTWAGWRDGTWSGAPIKSLAKDAIPVPWTNGAPVSCKDCVVVDQGEGAPWNQAGGVIFRVRYSFDRTVDFGPPPSSMDKQLRPIRGTLTYEDKVIIRLVKR